MNNFRFLSLAAKGWQISMDIIVEKFKISKILSFNGAMHLLKAETYKIHIELEKVGPGQWFIIFKFSQYDSDIVTEIQQDLCNKKTLIIFFGGDCFSYHLLYIIIIY